MSKVYSFRLDENNPREAQAREVIDAWVFKGFSLRYTLTEALILFKGKDGNSDLHDVLGQLREVISELGNEQSKGTEDKNKIIEVSPLFLSAIKKSAKSGLRSK